MVIIDHVRTDQVIAPGRADQHAVEVIAQVCVVLEGGQSAEGVEDHRSSNSVGDLDAVSSIGGTDVPERYAPPYWVFADVPSMSVPSRALPTLVCVIVTQTEEVGLDHGVVRVTDADAIAEVAIDDVCIDERTLGEARAGQDIAVGPTEDPHAVEAVAQRRVAGDVGADEVGGQGIRRGSRR